MSLSFLWTVSVPIIRCMHIPKPTYTDSAYAILKRVPHVTAWKKNEIPEKFVYGKNPRVGICLYCRISERICNSVPNRVLYLLLRTDIITLLLRWKLSSMRQGPQNVELPVMANVNLYLIIARLLNLQPALTEGDSAVVSTLFRKSE